MSSKDRTSSCGVKKGPKVEKFGDDQDLQGGNKDHALASSETGSRKL